MKNYLKYQKATKRAYFDFYFIVAYDVLLIIGLLTTSSMSFFWSDLYIQLLIILTFALPVIVLIIALLSLMAHKTISAKFLIALSVLVIFILRWLVYELSKMCIIC